MVKSVMEFLAAADPELGAAVQAEYDRQHPNGPYSYSDWSGIPDNEEYRAKWRDETIEEALANLPQTAQVME